MSRLVGEPVRAHVKDNSVITAFIWRKRLYQVEEVLDWWREPSEWWNGKLTGDMIQCHYLCCYS